MNGKQKALAQIEEIVFSKRGPVKMGSWRGKRAIKYPTDLILYAEMIQELKPDFIIESGTRFGGSAAFLADICRLQDHGHVVTIEIEESFVPEDLGDDYITSIIESSVSDEVKMALEQMFPSDNDQVMVILDSDHTPEHVAKELDIYSQYVSVGQYLIVEDLHQEGAIVAVDEFLKNNKNFVRDKAIEKYGIHAARDGFLKRVS